MLLFSTLLKINKKMTKDNFIQLIIEWNQGSPHKSNVIPDIQWNGDHNIRYGDENRWLDIQEYRNENIIAVRYERRDSDGAIWDTDYVMNFNTMTMAVRLDRSYLEEALVMDPKFSIPHLITLLIDRNYLEPDGDLPIVRDPIIIEDDRLQSVADVIKGRKKYRLPVVYISKTIYDEDPVDVKWLASRLKGIAHVLVQESRSQNSRFKELCNKKNEYYGAIGIYYFSHAFGHERYLYRSANGADKMLLEKVVSSVIRFSNSQMVHTLYTWQGVNNALLRDRLAYQRAERHAAEIAKKKAEDEALQLHDTLDEEERRIRQQALEDARAEADKILDGFDQELQDLQAKIEELTRENERLQYENQGMKNRLDNRASDPILYAGNEYDLYPGELKDLILSVLSDSISNLPQKSRRLDVVRDIIRSNDYRKISEKKAEKIKKLLKNYDGMTPKLKQELEELGLVITADGKHYKVTYYGDGRYQTVYAKTPSDGRSGKNNAQTTIRMAF